MNIYINQINEYLLSTFSFYLLITFDNCEATVFGKIGKTRTHTARNEIETRTGSLIEGASGAGIRNYLQNGHSSSNGKEFLAEPSGDGASVDANSGCSSGFVRIRSTSASKLTIT